SKESQDVVRLGMALVTSVAALVLGLLIASAKGSYDTRRNDLTQMCANIVLLDRVLAQYGPEAKEARDRLRGSVTRLLHRFWPEERPQSEPPEAAAPGGEAGFDALQRPAPQDESQRSLKSEARSLAVDIGRTRWLLYVQSGSSITPAFLVVLVFWLTLVLLSFGLYAPRNAVVVAGLFISALAVSGALFLILELDEPLRGLVRIPSTPAPRALVNLGH